MWKDAGKVGKTTSKQNSASATAKWPKISQELHVIVSKNRYLRPIQLHHTSPLTTTCIVVQHSPVPCSSSCSSHRLRAELLPKHALARRRYGFDPVSCSSSCCEPTASRRLDLASMTGSRRSLTAHYIRVRRSFAATSSRLGKPCPGTHVQAESRLI